MKNILILGGFGFLGTNVMKYVDEHLRGQYRFIVFDKFDHHLGGVEFGCVAKTYAGDFTNRDLLEQIFRENKIDIVLHSLSTTVPVDSSNARFDVESNLIPTLDVLGLMVKYDVKDIVYLSSGGAVYGVKGERLEDAAKLLLVRGYKETDDVYPVSSYGVVKLAIEKYLMQYAQLYGLKPLILRLSNPYGPYHYSMKQGVINVAMTKALKGETLEIWGSGEGKKDYIFVEDYVDILFRLLAIGEWRMANGEKLEATGDRLQEIGVINVASGQLLSVNEIVEAVKGYVPDFQVEYKDAQKFDASHFALDTTKLMALLPDFKFTNFEDGLEQTYVWTQEYLKH